MPRWSLPEEFGGEACARPLLIQRYAQLAGGSLTAVFILSQHDAALRRLLAATESVAAGYWLHAVGAGRAFATVGISHLTTSRRLGSQAIRVTEVTPGCYRLDGTMPWVTAAERADLFVTGAAMDDGRQMLIALPSDRPGVIVRPPFALAALQASCTSQVDLRGVEIRRFRPSGRSGARPGIAAGSGWHRRPGNLGACPRPGPRGLGGSGRAGPGSDRAGRAAGGAM